MHRSFWWSTVVILAVLVAPLSGIVGLPAQPAQAEPLAPAAAPLDDEVILLTSTGQIRVEDPVTPAGYKPATWNSGASQGWTLVAAGDFNGDGDAEIVGTQGNIFQVFDPIVQPGRQPVSFGPTSLSGIISLVVTGDFDGDGRDEIAIVHQNPSGGSTPFRLVVYDGGTNATAGEWTISFQTLYNAAWQDMAAGDVNGDGADDLVMVRNIDRQIIVYNGRNWTTLAQQSAYATDWYAVATGNMWAAYTGSEIALTRYGASAQINSLLLMRVAGGVLSDLGGSYRQNPEFTSLATGDVNGDGDDELLMLRNPIVDKASLLMVNPAGAAIRDFQASTGHTAPLFTLVRMGDVDGDGRAEVVIERSDRYRIYFQPEIDNSFVDYPGSNHVLGSVSNRPTLAVANIDGPGMPLGPVLAVSPSTLAFTLEYHEPSPTKTVSITNTGTSDTITWQAEVQGGVSWLNLASTSGTTPGTLGVSVDSSQLTPSATPYTAKIKITATAPSGVQSSPQEVSVSVTISGVTMVVNPTLLSFDIGYGDTVAAKPVTISSQGGSAPFAWSASVLEGLDWLRVSPTEGMSPTTMNVRVDSRAVPPGHYSGTIRVRAQDPQVAAGIQFVTVDLTVRDGGVVVTPDQVTVQRLIGAPPATAQVLIERPGIPTAWVASVLPAALADVARAKFAAGEYQVTETGVVLEGVEAPDLDWLSFTPSSGTTDTTMTLTFRGNTPGTQKAIIFVSSATGTRELAVTQWVAANFHDSFLPLLMK